MEVDPTIQPNQRDQWNGFVDFANQQGNTNLADPALLDQHKQTNPDFSITPEMVPAIQEDQNKFKTGDSFSTLNPDQLKAVRTGMSPEYLNSQEVSKYPQFKMGSQDFGTNVEEYAKAKDGPGDPVKPVAAIPKPNYDDPKSRLDYAKQFTAKYGSLMQGRGDTPLRINENPENGSDSAKNLSIKAASKVGLDPALLYSSAMEEGMSGLYPDKKGQVDDSGDDKYPVSGFVSFGLDNFADKFPELVKKGYLPKEFADNFKKSPEQNEKQQKVNSANFKTTDAALEAKAAMVKDAQDYTETYAKQNGIQLSDKAKQFFTLVNYNAGEGNMQKMIKEYSRSGYLKDDKFLDKRPSDSWKVPYENVLRRLKMADALKQEGLF